MQNINWFPGHMTAAMRKMQEDIKLVDAVIYVLDSRAPASCLNPSLDELIGAKPIVYALNKADLGDKSLISLWAGKLSGENSAAVALNGTALSSAKPLISAVKKICQKRIDFLKQKGINATLRIMVIGVPNCGKSTIINSLCAQSRLKTGDRPGVTKGKQWVRVSDFLEVLDTPGTLYPKLDDQKKALRLCYISSIKDDIFDSYELALALCDELNSVNENIFKNRYDITYQNAQQTIEGIALKRNYKLKGGEPDYQRAANALIDDFRKGRLGAVTLERP